MQNSVWDSWRKARYKPFVAVLGGLAVTAASLVFGFDITVKLTKMLGFVPTTLMTWAMSACVIYVVFGMLWLLRRIGDEETMTRSVVFSTLALLALGYIAGIGWILFLLIELKESVGGMWAVSVWFTSMLAGLAIMTRMIVYF